MSSPYGWALITFLIQRGLVIIFLLICSVQTEPRYTSPAIVSFLTLSLKLTMLPACWFKWQPPPPPFSSRQLLKDYSSPALGVSFRLIELSLSFINKQKTRTNGHLGCFKLFQLLFFFLELVVVLTEPRAWYFQGKHSSTEWYLLPHLQLFNTMAIFIQKAWHTCAMISLK